MDITQTFIVISLAAISIAVIFVTVYLVSLIKDLRITVTRINRILEDTQNMTASISRPLSSFSDFLMGFKNGFKLFNTFFKKDKYED